MFTAAGKAAELTADSSPIEIRKVMGELMATSAVYMKKINEKGGGNLGTGKKKGYYRLLSAKDLNKIARSALLPVDRMTYPYESLPNQIKPEFKNTKTSKKVENKKINNTKTKA